jgi:hypothetical protein
MVGGLSSRRLRNGLLLRQLNIALQIGDPRVSMELETASNVGKRKMYNTTLDAELVRKIKILAAQLEKRQNDLIEEAIKDLLNKYQLQAS